jgi:uncharacterized CHY-type Zn-finger protein
MKKVDMSKEQDRCILCGKIIKLEDFKDELSIREFNISGLCQQCQDNIFEEEEP